MGSALNKGEMLVNITDDGRLKVETGDMGGVNHKAADDFLKTIATALGLAPEVESTKHHHHHHHDHGHSHTHEGGGDHHH